MSIIDRQIELGRNLFQINASALRAYGELQRDNIEKYFQLNAEYWEKLPTIKDVSEFVELQRSYSESLWTGVKDSTRTQVDLVKEALEEAGAAVREAMEPEEPKKAAAPAKPKAAKKPAARKGAERAEPQTH